MTRGWISFKVLQPKQGQSVEIASSTANLGSVQWNPADLEKMLGNWWKVPGSRIDETAP